MSQPLLRDSRGVYHWKGEDYVSVTTVLGVLSKPAIAPWAAKCVAERVQELLDKGRDERWDYGRLRAELAIERIKGAPWETRDDKAALGTLIHDIAEKWALGSRLALEVFAPDVRAYAESLYSFLEGNDVKFLAAEATVFSKKHRYAGTMDGICVINGRTLLADYKTSSASYPEHALQMAAYRHADFIASPETGDETPIPEVEGAAIILVHPDECKLVEWECGSQQLDTFLKLREVYDWVNSKQKPIGANARRKKNANS